MTHSPGARGAKRRPKGSGTVRQLDSGRWQARHRGADGVLRPAPVTFDTRLDANRWLKVQTDDVAVGVWTRPERRTMPTLRGYADLWLDQRNLKPSTRALYRQQLDRLILPDLGAVPLDRITPTTVRAWWASLGTDNPTQRSQAYGLLRAITRTAVDDDLIDASPCRIRGAGSARKAHQTRIATLAELDTIVSAVPDRYRAMVLLAAWCGLRAGELLELRRRDIDIDPDADRGVVSVERGMTRVNGEHIVGTPKSEAGRRRVAVPPHVVPALRHHMNAHVGAASEALLFPARGGGHMAPSTLYRVYYPARERAGRPDLRFHDLRHTGATMAAATGATLAELQARLGHSTVAAAMRYQHAAQDRDAVIADALSGLAAAPRTTASR